MSAPDYMRSLEGEELLISCVMQRPDLFAVAQQQLTAKHFRYPHLRVIWETLGEMQAAGVPADLALLTERLSSTPDPSGQTLLQAVGGAHRVAAVATKAVSPDSQFAPAVDVLCERYRRAELVPLLQVEANRLLSGVGTDEVIPTLVDRLESLRARSEAARACDAATLAREVYADLENPERTTPALATGLDYVDLLLDGGFRLGTHTIVGAGSGHGKTTFTSTIVAGLLSTNPDLHVIWYSCEVPAKWQFLRIASSFADVSERFWRDARRDEATQVYRRALKALDWGLETGNRLHIHNEAPNLSRIRLETRIRRAQIANKPLCVVVDYLQRANPGTPTSSPYDRVAEASRMLAELADEQTFTIGLSQFTDSPTNQEPIPLPKPTMARWAKDLHHDACDWLTYHRPLQESFPEFAIVQLAKSRYGRLAHVNLIGTPSNRFVWLRHPGSDAIRALTQVHSCDWGDLVGRATQRIDGLHTVEVRPTH